MKNPLNLLAVAIMAIGMLFAGGAAQAASFTPAPAVAADSNLVQKSHGYHRYWSRGHRHGRRWRRRWHRPYRARGCGWLRRRANYTGSPYWWRRYRHCMARRYW